MSAPMLYFAYGSNLLEERLRLHVPAARWVAVAELAGWQRRFQLRSGDGSAKCDAVRTAGTGDGLQGVLYELGASDRAALDEWEGLGGMYRLEHVEVRTVDGTCEAFLYAGSESHIDRSLRPYDWYLASVLAGARRHGLSGDVINSLLAEPVWPDPDPQRATRNWALIPPSLR